MLVGNGAWSFTLDRMDNQKQAQTEPLSRSLPASSHPAASAAHARRVIGVRHLRWQDPL